MEATMTKADGVSDISMSTSSSATVLMDQNQHVQPDSDSHQLVPTSDLPVVSTFDETTGNLMQFTLFPKLPAELRLQIWENTTEPRLVRFKSWEVRTFDFMSYTCTNPKALPIDPPPILSTCHESRTVALREYRNIGERIHSYPVYFSPSLDTLYTTKDINQLHLCHRAEIQSLAILDWRRRLKKSITSVGPKEWFNFNGISSFSEYKSLKELIVVKDQKVSSSPIDELRPITAEDELPPGGAQSGDVHREYTNYLKENWVKLGGSSDREIPVVKVLGAFGDLMGF